MKKEKGGEEKSKGGVYWKGGEERGGREYGMERMEGMG